MLRETLLDAANKGKLNSADTKQIRELTDDLSPSKIGPKKSKKEINDKMREMYAKYWKTLKA